MLHIQDIKDEAVVVYGESLITKKMGYHRLSQRVNKMGFLTNLCLIYRCFMNVPPVLLKHYVNEIHKIFFPFCLRSKVLE